MCKYCKGEYGNDYVKEYNSEWQISKDPNSWCLEVEIETQGVVGNLCNIFRH